MLHRCMAWRHDIGTSQRCQLSLRHAVQVYGLEQENWDKSALSIVVVGASGDLAKKKIYPALFALYVEVGLVIVMCAVLCQSACCMKAVPAVAALWPAWCEEVSAGSWDIPVAPVHGAGQGWQLGTS